MPQGTDRATWQARIDELRVKELSYLNSRDVSYATFCQCPYEESSRYRDFMG